MNIRWRGPVAASLVLLGVYGLPPSRAQQLQQSTEERFRNGEAVVGAQAPGEKLLVEHAECAFFGPQRDRFLPRATAGGESQAGRWTRQFATAAARSGASHGGHTKPFQSAQSGSANLIDKFIWADLQSNNIAPSFRINDFEFIRRVTLDVTGRIPAPERVLNFTSSSDPNKRAKLIDELLAKPEWVDKWTMFYGDLYQNTASKVQVNRRAEGRNAFYKWIHDSLAANKPYDQIATELIAAQGTDSFDQANGQMNWLVGGVVTGGPAQDIFDQQAANVAETFLGMTHVNCVLCHNGRGHLDSLSLWGSHTTRMQAWGMAAFMAHTWTRAIATPMDPNNPAVNNNVRFWSLDQYKTDYALNTTTGNRPARQPVGTLKVVTPSYLFGAQTPAKNTDYRTALATFVTGDFQFARAAVNYVWAAYFGRGIVDPPDQFDPARLDPDNPPPDPWTLQPSNPRLLNALAQSFIDSGYDLKALMRLIATSDTYQLSSEYDDTWNPTWEKFFARKLVRRLWGEELHDAVVDATGMVPSYNAPGFSLASALYGVDSPGFGKISYAMQAPDVVNMPDGGGASAFIDAFLRGNRDDAPRKTEGSILQTLNLMNDNFIESRIHSAGTGASMTFLAKIMNLPDEQLVATLYLNVLSRVPSDDEKAIALAKLRTGERKNSAEDLLWTLFNKVDFVFNY